MKAFLSASSLVLALTMPSMGSASELKPLEAGTFMLGTHTVSIYYTVSDEAYEVVTTIAPAPDTSGAPIRFVGFLRPGQVETLSVGSFGTATAPAALELVHDGDMLSVIQKAQTAQLD